MPLPVLTRVGTTAVVDRVATQELLVHQNSAYALRPANAMFACPRSCSTKHRESPVGTGSSQDHANEAERSWLQRVALEFFSRVAGGKLTELPVHERRPVVQGPFVTLRPPPASLSESQEELSK